MVTMHPVQVELRERMLACVPDSKKHIFSRLEEINDELRRTDVRLMDSPSDEQIQYFLSLLDECDDKIAAFNKNKEDDPVSKDSVLLINYIFNLTEVLRCQRLRAKYTWRDRIQTDGEDLDFEDMEE